MSLYVEGPLGSGKTEHLVEQVLKLVDDGQAATLLVLCSHHARKKAFTQRLYARLSQPMTELAVYTYSGYVRTSLFNFWPLVEQRLMASESHGHSLIRPTLSGMEDSELLLKKLVSAEKISNPVAFTEFPGTDDALVKQLIRRVRLRSENRLERPEMTRRSQLLGEMAIAETARIERQFDQISYALRVLDANKQLDVFHGLLENSAVFQQWLQQHVKHLIVDDVDETIPAQQAFIRFIAPTLDTLILSADIDGGSRRGYLNAYPYDWEALKQLHRGSTKILERNDLPAHSAQRLLENWKQTNARRFQPLSETLINRDPAITRVEMLDQVLSDMFQLMDQGYRPGDMAVITPVNDLLTTHALRTRLGKRAIKLQLLSGTQRPFDNPICRAFLYLLQWANSRQWSYYLSPIETKTLLSHLLKLQLLDPKALDPLVYAITAHQQNPDEDPDQPPTLAPSVGELDKRLSVPITQETRRRYDILVNWLEKSRGRPLHEQMLSAFDELITPYATEHDTFSDIQKIMESYERQTTIEARLQAMHRTTGSNAVPEPDIDRIWLSQAKTGVVADTPDTPMEVDANAVILGTPQKLIDYETHRKVQFWLDVNSREWARTDNAPLYNAWVHSAVWDGSTAAFSEEAKDAFVRTRAAHLTRTLMLLAQEQVRTYASELDDQGFNQSGLLQPRLVSETADPLGEQAIERATLRSDQQPVLQYRTGTMAITAVPGAGKTFINVELMLELIENGIQPNQILVLTYMDSAAKTLLSRIKRKLDHVTNQLPVISTIHSLAFRILTENDHALALGFLPEDVEILDDFGQDEILVAIANQTRQEPQSTGQWLRTLRRGIAYAKTHGLTPDDLAQFVQQHPQSFWLRQFIPAYRLYEQQLTERGCLDFTDLILKAVAVLEQSSDVRTHYQNQFRVIIEDEAQDSSKLLQRFIGLIGGEQPNLIRTGDTNQSITTTFSSADTSVFREFISDADRVVTMDRSGRCAPEIIHLANLWMKRAAEIPDLANAFQPVAMKPLSDNDFGDNPVLLNRPEARLFDIDKDEERWIAETIQRYRREHPDLSIAVLPAYNEQVNRIAGLLQDAGIPAISFSERLGANPVFNTLLAYLKLIAAPGDTQNQVRLHDAMVDARLIPPNPERQTFLGEKPVLYQKPELLEDEYAHQLYYDIIDFSRDALGSDISRLLVRMTDHLFQTVEDRSNGYCCAIQARDILRKFDHVDHLSPLELVIQQFESLQHSRQRSRSFTELLGQANEDFVQVMTLHKAKGQEFDVVFMPFLRKTRIEFNAEDKLVRELDAVLAGGKLPDSYIHDNIRTKSEEKARLIYVGITRAKRALHLSAHTSYHTRYHRLEQAEPSIAYTLLNQLIREELQTQESQPLA